jgi:hypothetical protein
MKSLTLVLFAVITSLLAGSVKSSAQIQAMLGGYCDGFPAAQGTPFVLNGLGEREPDPTTVSREFTQCSYGVGEPFVWLGEPAARPGTLHNLYVKQGRLATSSMGGTVTILLNSKTGGRPTTTAITCTLGAITADFYQCNDTNHSITVANW